MPAHVQTLIDDIRKAKHLDADMQKRMIGSIIAAAKRVY